MARTGYPRAMDRHGVPDLDDDDAPTGDEHIDEWRHAVSRDSSLTVGAEHPATEHGMPAEVVIAGRTYAVMAYTQDGSTDEHEGFYGYIDFDADAIRVNLVDREELRDTFLHEVLHAVDSWAGTEAGEALVSVWTPIILDLLRRNHAVVAYLTADD